MGCERLCRVVGAVALVALAGCNEDPVVPMGPDLSGWYEVTHHTLSDGDCVTEGADATGLPFIRLTSEVHESSEYLALRRCQDLEEAACDNEDFFHGTSFLLPMEYGWEERKTAAAYQPMTGDCYLSYGVSTLLQSGEGVVIELRRYEALEPGLTAEDCTYGLAAARGDTMPCLDYEVIHAQPPLD